ncbi:MAG: polysaccharide pyruvyl transferase family protein [bacterium]|nr:polysaccharide pyruvyl transferase family protein [bacterium]
MNVAIFGNYGVKNLGDDLILSGLLAQLEEQGFTAVVFCGFPEQARRQFGVEAHPFFPAGIRSAWKWFTSASYRAELGDAYRALQNADRVLIGGGGIVVDRHFKAVLLWWRQLMAIRKSGKPYQFIANSLELRHWWSRWLFKPYLAGAERITVRDRASQALLKSMNLPSEVVPDLALRPTLASSAPEKKICLALCRWGLKRSHLDALRSFCQQLQDQNYQLVGLAFQTFQDDDRQVFARLGLEIPVKFELSEVLAELSSAQLLIGMRLHSLILAEHFQTPTIAIAYQDKVKHFMEDREKESQVLHISDIDLDKLQQLFERLQG